MNAQELKQKISEKNLTLSPLFTAQNRAGEIINVGILEGKNTLFGNRFIVKFRGAYHAVNLEFSLTKKESIIKMQKLYTKKVFGVNIDAAFNIVSFADGTEININSDYHSSLNAKDCINMVDVKKRIATTPFVAKTPKAPKNYKIVDGTPVYSTGNYSEDVLSGYYSE